VPLPSLVASVLASLLAFQFASLLRGARPLMFSLCLSLRLALWGAVRRPGPPVRVLICALLTLVVGVGAPSTAHGHTASRTLATIEVLGAEVRGADAGEAAGAVTVSWQLHIPVRLLSEVASAAADGPTSGVGATADGLSFAAPQAPPGGPPAAWIADHVARGLTVQAGEVFCSLRDKSVFLPGGELMPSGKAIEETVGVNVLFFCPPADNPAITATYNLFFGHDPLHTALVRLRVGSRASRHTEAAVGAGEAAEQAVGGAGGFTAVILRASSREVALERPPDRLTVILSYLGLGIEHIFLGLDHLAFLASLMLGLLLQPSSDASSGGADFSRRTAARLGRSVLGVVTAFTVAHSVTLIFATLRPGWVPTVWVEPAIALSIVLVALENLRSRRVLPLRLGAFALGLVHGFGFSSVLAEIGLPRTALVSSLLAFNLGVEIGQIVVLGLAAPVVVWVWGRAAPSSRMRRGRAASISLAALGGYWFLQRVGAFTFMN